ncbi:hypothetical protein C8R45DRAFT_936295 [Mycena sanguinolenta]|nr:hypothetical protein C8R45DRAFT_936295 [Mycena sanguinolenta]
MAEPVSVSSAVKRVIVPGSRRDGRSRVLQGSRSEVQLLAASVVPGQGSSPSPTQALALGPDPSPTRVGLRQGPGSGSEIFATLDPGLGPEFAHMVGWLTFDEIDGTRAFTFPKHFNGAPSPGSGPGPTRPDLVGGLGSGSGSGEAQALPDPTQARASKPDPTRTTLLAAVQSQSFRPQRGFRDWKCGQELTCTGDCREEQARRFYQTPSREDVNESNLACGNPRRDVTVSKDRKNDVWGQVGQKRRHGRHVFDRKVVFALGRSKEVAGTNQQACYGRNHDTRRLDSTSAHRLEHRNSNSPYGLEFPI